MYTFYRLCFYCAEDLGTTAVENQRARFRHRVSDRSRQCVALERCIALERRVATAERCHKANRMHNLDVGNYCT